MAQGFSQWLDTITGQQSFEQLAGKYTVSVTGIDTDGIEGFQFTLTKDYEVNLSSSITDYPVEDGNVAQNVITLMPEKLKLTGMAAEISYGEDYITHLFDTLSASLIPVSALLPSVSIITQEIKGKLENKLGELKLVTDEIKKYVNVANTAAALMGLPQLGGEESPFTQQQKAYYYLELCWKSRKLLQIETPWRVFDNMVIEDLKFTQDETTKYASNIEVSFKRIIRPQQRQKEDTLMKQGRAQSAVKEAINVTGEGLTQLYETGKETVNVISNIDVLSENLTNFPQVNIVNEIFDARGNLE